MTARLLKRLSQTFVHQPLKEVLNILESGRIGVEVRPTDVIGCLSRTLMSMLQATNDCLKRLKTAGWVGLGRVVEGGLVVRDELIDGIPIQGHEGVCVGIRNFRLRDEKCGIVVGRYSIETSTTEVFVIEWVVAMSWTILVGRVAIESIQWLVVGLWEPEQRLWLHLDRFLLGPTMLLMGLIWCWVSWLMGLQLLIAMWALIP